MNFTLSEKNNQGDPLCVNCQDPTAIYYDDRERGHFTCSCGCCLDELYVDDSERHYADSSVDKRRGDYTNPHYTYVTQIGNGRNTLNSIHQNMILGDEKSVDKNLQRGITRLTDYSLLMANIEGRIIKESKNMCSLFFKQYQKDRTKTIGEKNIDPLVLAIVYIVCAKNGTGDTIRMLSLISNIPESKIRKQCKIVKSTLSMYPQLIRQTSAKDFTRNFCSSLQCDPIIENFSNYIIDQVEQYFEGKRPSTLAAACIYSASIRYPKNVGSIFSLNSLSLFSDMAESTIMSTYEEVTKIIIDLSSKNSVPSDAKKSRIK
jgi:transcription initiation factor TFIIIB Brf1 subunit/transcription initiation factor TFIIB